MKSPIEIIDEILADLDSKIVPECRGTTSAIQNNIIRFQKDTILKIRERFEKEYSPNDMKLLMESKKILSNL